MVLGSTSFIATKKVYCTVKLNRFYNNKKKYFAMHSIKMNPVLLDYTVEKQ